jgi:hypothetical protein
MALPINSIMPTGPAYGVSMGMIPTSSNSAGINISAATTSAVCYVSFNSNGRTPTQNGYIAYNNNDNSMYFNTIQGQHMKLDGTNGTCSVLIGTSTSSSANKLYVNGQSYAVTVAGGTKTFDIPHQSKPGMRLRHRCIESPEAGVLYRFRMNCEVGDNKLTLPDYYTWLATDPYVFVSPYKCFGCGWGDVDAAGKTLTVTVNLAGTYNILLSASRADDMAVAEYNEHGVEYIGTN